MHANKVNNNAFDRLPDDSENSATTELPFCTVFPLGSLNSFASIRVHSPLEMVSEPRMDTNARE